MDLSELKAKKRVTQGTIRDILYEFQESTGVCIKDVNVELIRNDALSVGPRYLVGNVELTLDL